MNNISKFTFIMQCKFKNAFAVCVVWSQFSIRIADNRDHHMSLRTQIQTMGQHSFFLLHHCFPYFSNFCGDHVLLLKNNLFFFKARVTLNFYIYFKFFIVKYLKHKKKKDACLLTPFQVEHTLPHLTTFHTFNTLVSELIWNKLI